MKLSKTILTLTVIAFLFSCDDGDPEINFHWELSDLDDFQGSSYFSDGDELYGLGYVGSEYGVYKSVDNHWVLTNKLVPPDLSGYTDFVLINNNVYLFDDTGSPTYWRATDEGVSQIFAEQFISGIYEINSKLIAAGSFTDDAGNHYGIVSTTDGVNLNYPNTTNSDIIPSVYLLDQTLDKMYFLNGDGAMFAYDGTSLTAIDGPDFDYAPLAFTVRANGEFYYTSRTDEGRSLIKKWTGGESTTAGQVFPFEVGIRYIFTKGDDVIAVGMNVNTERSATYVLRGNKWISVKTPQLFIDSFKHDDRIFSYDEEGHIYELIEN